MMMEEQVAEVESRANSLQSNYKQRGGVAKATRVDTVASRFVSAGGFHSAVVDDEGVLWVWGRNEEGQLGLGEGTTTRDMHYPKMVPLDSDGRLMTQVVCGIRTTAAIDGDGALWTWGHSKGYLGHDDIQWAGLSGSPNVTCPRLVKWSVTALETGVKIAAVSLGWSHSACLDSTGNVYTWGYGCNGRLGHGRALRDSPLFSST